MCLIISVVVSMVFNIDDPLDSYAEGYFFNYTNPIVVNITASDVFYNLDNFTFIYYHDFYFDKESVIAKTDGLYKIIGDISLQGGNSGLYLFELFNNNVSIPTCSAYLTTSTTDTRTTIINCMIYLNVGDSLNVRVKDIAVPAQPITISQMNINIRRFL